MRLPARPLGVLLLFAASLLGCASTATPPPISALAPPSAWTAATVEIDGRGVVGEAGAMAADDDRWWRGLGSPSLDDLVEEALANNHDVAVAVARVEGAVAEARVSGADLRPSVTLGLDAQRSKRNFIGFPIPGSESDILSTTSSTTGLSVEVSWEVDLWGRLRARQLGAVEELEAAAADRYGVALSIAGGVVQGWLSLIEANQQVDLAARTFESRRRAEQRLESRYRTGLTGALDLRLARSERARAESSVQGLRRVLDASKRPLETLVGRYPSATLELPPLLPTWSGPIPDALPAELVARRPDLQASELRLRAAGARVDEARRALYPRLVLNGSGGTVSSRIGDLLDGDFSVWALAGGLLQPLFQGGRLRSAADLALSKQEQLLHGYLQQVLQAFAEVETALTSEDYLREQERVMEQAMQESKAAETLALRRYLTGLESYLAVLEAQRQSFASESRYLQLRRQRLEARIDVVLALGGGYRYEPYVRLVAEGRKEEGR